MINHLSTIAHNQLNHRNMKQSFGNIIELVHVLAVQKQSDNEGDSGALPAALTVCLTPVRAWWIPALLYRTSCWIIENPAGLKVTLLHTINHSGRMYPHHRPRQPHLSDDDIIAVLIIPHLPSNVYYNNRLLNNLIGKQAGHGWAKHTKNHLNNGTHIGWKL